MLKKIKLKDAVGTKLAHDITEIRPGEFKGPAFRKGHTVCNEDLCHLQKLGKNHLYEIDLAEDDSERSGHQQQWDEHLGHRGLLLSR